MIVSIRILQTHYLGLSLTTFNYICNFVINIKTNVYFRKELINFLKDVQSLYDDKGQSPKIRNGLIVPWNAKHTTNGDLLF